MWRNLVDFLARDTGERGGDGVIIVKSVMGLDDYVRNEFSGMPDSLECSTS